MTARKRARLQIMLIAIILIVAIFYGFFIKPNYYNFNGGKIFFEPIYVESFVGHGKYQLYTYENYIYLSTNNGLKKLSSKGDNIWDKTYYFQHPKLFTANQYMAVVDISGKEANLFDKNGLVVNIVVDYPIIMAELNDKGALLIVQEYENKHIIQLYNRTGALMAERGTNFSSDGYPISVDLSSSGEKMVTSYLSVKNQHIQSVISFFSFEEEVKKDPENIIGMVILENTLAAEVKFIDETHLVVIGDNLLNFYYMVEDSLILENSIEINNPISEVAINNKNVILYFDKIIDATAENTENKVVVYNNKGELIDNYIQENQVNTINSEGDSYYLITDTSVEKHSGNRLQWETTIQNNVVAMRMLEKNKYLVIYDYGYEIVKIKSI